MGVIWEITDRVEGEVAVVRVVARGIHLSESEPRLWLRIQELLEQGRVRVLLNMHGVTYVDSFGLGEIIRGFNAARLAGGKLGLCDIAPRIQGLLVAAKLTDIIPIFDTEEAGIKALG
jgi:anti-sigma B factor antagonist